MNRLQLRDDELRGSYPPLVTPLRDGEVDAEAYVRLVERHVALGSHGVVACGTSAEPSTLTAAERNLLVRLAVDTADRRIPVVAATGSGSHAETVALTEAAVAAGADAVMIVTPYYVKPSQTGLVAYYRDLASRWDVPLLVYDIPGRTGVHVEAATLEEIAAACPTLVGIKHASADLDYVTDVLGRLGRDFRVFCGLEALSFPMLTVGASGLMNAVANVVPAEVAALYEAAARGDLARARELHDDLFDLNRAVFWDTNPVPVKHLLARIGVIDTAEHRLPLVAASPELAARLDALAEKKGLMA